MIFSLGFFTSLLLPTQEHGKGNVNPAFWENSAAWKLAEQDLPPLALPTLDTHSEVI